MDIDRSSRVYAGRARVVRILNRCLSDDRDSEHWQVSVYDGMMSRSVEGLVQGSELTWEGRRVDIEQGRVLAKM